MPTPRKDESRDEFFDRCMGDDEAVEDFPDPKRRGGFCKAQWEGSQGRGLPRRIN
jgi:hypothetical protein